MLELFVRLDKITIIDICEFNPKSDIEVKKYIIFVKIIVFGLFLS